jgi:hypothetical protein
MDHPEAEITAPIGLLGEGAVQRHLGLGLIDLADDPQRALRDPRDRDRDLGRGRAGADKTPGYNERSQDEGGQARTRDGHSQVGR